MKIINKIIKIIILKPIPTRKIKKNFTFRKKIK
jgi:hypothetical protein